MKIFIFLFWVTWLRCVVQTQHKNVDFAYFYNILNCCKNLIFQQRTMLHTMHNRCSSLIVLQGLVMLSNKNLTTTTLMARDLVIYCCDYFWRNWPFWLLILHPWVILQSTILDGLLPSLGRLLFRKWHLPQSRTNYNKTN